MRRFSHTTRWLLGRIWDDRRGQDMIEYALLAGFVAFVGAAILPGPTATLSTIFSKVTSIVTNSAG